MEWNGSVRVLNVVSKIDSNEQNVIILYYAFCLLPPFLFIIPFLSSSTMPLKNDEINGRETSSNHKFGKIMVAY